MTLEYSRLPSYIVHGVHRSTTDTASFATTIGINLADVDVLVARVVDVAPLRPDQLHAVRRELSEPINVDVTGTSNR